MIVLAYAALPLHAKQQQTLVQAVEREASRIGFAFPLFLEVLDQSSCSPSARGQLHFTVFSQELTPQRQKALSRALLTAASSCNNLEEVHSAVIFKTIPPEAMAYQGSLLSDSISHAPESEEYQCIPS